MTKASTSTGKPTAPPRGSSVSRVLGAAGAASFLTAAYSVAGAVSAGGGGRGRPGLHVGLRDRDRADPRVRGPPEIDARHLHPRHANRRRATVRPSHLEVLDPALAL